MGKIIKVSGKEFNKYVKNLLNEQLDPTQQMGKWVLDGGKWVWNNIMNPNVGNTKSQPNPQPQQQQPQQQTQQNVPQDQKSVVGNIQTQLNSLGFLNAKPTGYYGPKTKQAVMDWQKSKGMKVDGYFIKGRDDVKLGNITMGSVPRLFYQPPVQKPVAPVQKAAPSPAQNNGDKYNDAAMSGINNVNQRSKNLPNPKVSLRQPNPDTIATDYRKRQGNV